MEDCKKSIQANKEVLELHFDKSEQLPQAADRMAEINAQLDEKYHVEPELEKETEQGKSHKFKKNTVHQNMAL